MATGSESPDNKRDAGNGLHTLESYEAKNCKARVDVVHSLENDMPGQSSLGFLSRSINTYDIFVDSNDEQSYLKIHKNKVEFGSYDANSRKFYKYRYSGGDPSKGAVVAFSQIKMKPPFSSNMTSSDKTCFAGKGDTEVEAKNFPSYMVGQRIKLDSRLWYEKADTNSNLHTLESYKANDRFLGKDNNTDRAILSETKTLLTIKDSGPVVDEPLAKLDACEADGTSCCNATSETGK